MVFRCGVLTAAGTPCQAVVSREGGKCKQHQIRTVRTGRYSKYLRRDIAQRVKELAEDVIDTEEEEALVRWMLTEFLQAYENNEISREQIYTNLLAGLETLRRAYETREKLELAKKRIITPEDFVRLVAVLGDIVQKRVSDKRERQLVAADFASLLLGQRGVIALSHYEHPRLDLNLDVREIIESAVPIS